MRAGAAKCLQDQQLQGCSWWNRWCRHAPICSTGELKTLRFFNCENRVSSHQPLSSEPLDAQGNERCGLWVCTHQSSIHHIYCPCPHTVKVGGVVPSEMLFCRPVVVTSKRHFPNEVACEPRLCIYHPKQLFVISLQHLHHQIVVFTCHLFWRVEFAHVPAPCLPWGWPAASSWIKVAAFASTFSLSPQPKLILCH